MSHDTNTTIPKTAHAVRVHAFGGNEETRYQQVPVTPPGEGEVLVRVAGAGVNPVDWKIVRGYLGAFLPTTMPFVPGWEIGRTIVARGHAARRFEVGAPVYNYIHSPTVEHGAYAEFVTVPEAYLAAAPTSLSLVEAAGVPLAGLTAYQCLHDATSLKPSETVVILGASGGVGGFAVQIAKAHGARVIAVASAANRDYCAGLGADDFIAYNEGPLTAAFEARKATADVILDCSGGGAALDASRAALKAGGRVASITTSAAPEGFAGVTYHYVFVEPNSAQLATLAALADAGKLEVHLHATLPLSSVVEAFEQSEGGHTRGKVVLIPG